MKLINTRQTALLLGVGPLLLGPAPLSQHPHLTDALNQLIQTGVGRKGGKARGMVRKERRVGV